MKICTKCKQEKELTEFPKDKTKKDGYDVYCKICKCERIKQIYYKNPEKEISKRKQINQDNKDKYYQTYLKNKVQRDKTSQIYRENNKDLIKLKQKEYIRNNKELHYDRCKISRLKNINYYKSKSKQNYLNNSEKIIAYGKAYDQLPKSKELRKLRNIENRKNPIFVLQQRCRSRISKFFIKKRTKKLEKTENIIGCNWDQFKIWIESHFYDTISWTNQKEWHIDHAIPLSWAQSEVEVYKLNYYTNLKPIWNQENWKKRNFYGEIWDGKNWNRITKEEYGESLKSTYIKS